MAALTESPSEGFLDAEIIKARLESIEEQLGTLIGVCEAMQSTMDAMGATGGGITQCLHE